MSVGLWLVRHGETDWGATSRFTGWTDIPLNATGRAQARALRPLLAAHRFAAVWSSDLRRATETARLAGVEPATDARLRELDFGDLEGRTWSELSTDEQQGLLDFDGFQAPNGESVDALQARVLDFVDSLGDGEQLVITHGGVIRMLLHMAGADASVTPGDHRRLRMVRTASPERAWIIEDSPVEDGALPVSRRSSRY
jgi:probable phosphoglycerate mutase